MRIPSEDEYEDARQQAKERRAEREQRYQIDEEPTPRAADELPEADVDGEEEGD